MYIKTIEVENKGKSIKLGYIQDIRKVKTLRERLAFLGKNINLSHVVGCIDINMQGLNNCKIKATLSNGAFVDITELYNLTVMIESLENNIIMHTERILYGDSTLYIRKNKISIVTNLAQAGGYIELSRKCLSIPWLLNLKNKLYRDDHKEWLTT